MNTWIEPPPPQRGLGCFGKGCLILGAFFILLCLAFMGGTFCAVRYLRGEYFPRTGMELPAAAHSEQERQNVQTKWSLFETHARAHESAQIELTGDEINALIASEPELRGKAFVIIEENVAHLRVSIPLDNVRWLKGHYLNGECIVQSSADADPAGAKFTSIVVNGRPVAEEALRWQYGPWSIRHYLTDWTNQNNLKTFEIQDGRVVLESKSD